MLSAVLKVLSFELNIYESTCIYNYHSYLYLYSLVTVDGVGVLVMGLLVTVHAIVDTVALAIAAGKKAA